MSTSARTVGASGLGTLRWRVQAGLVALAIALVAIVGTGLYAIERVVDAFGVAHDELHYEALPLSALRSEVLAVEPARYEAVMTGTSAARASLDRRVAQIDKGFERVAGESLTEEGESVAAAQEQWRAAVAVITSVPSTGSRDSRAAALAPFTMAIHGTAASLRAAEMTSSADADAELHEAREAQQRTSVLFVTMGTVALGLLWVGLRQLIRRTLDPVARLSGATRQLGADDFTVRVPREELVELRQVADAFNAMVQELGRTHAALSHQALHDPLTGLANRALAYQRLDALARTVDAQVAAVLVDLDGFKEGQRHLRPPRRRSHSRAGSRAVDRFRPP